MARAVRDKKLDSKAARAKLPTRGKPYYRTISLGLHIGFRKGKRGGVWVLRRYAGSERYEVSTIAAADDDHRDADGVDVLTFDQAVARARERAGAAVEQERLAKFGAPITVSAAIEQYLTQREKRESFGNKRDARSRLTRHVGEELAAKDMATLTDEDLRDWRSQLTAKAAHQRKGAPLSETTVRRTVADLKAALNAAAVRYRKRLPASIAAEIRSGLKNPKGSPAVARQAQVLPEADIRAIIDAAGHVDREWGWGGDLQRLVLVLAATGARLSQVARLRVADVRLERLQIMVPTSRKGSIEKDMPNIRVRIGADVAAMLKPVVDGRKGSELLLMRPRWRPTTGWKKWEVAARDPWRASNELARPWAAIIAKAGLSKAVVPYALRHSSIVRGLKAGLPVRLVAAMHDTSSAMVERHYSTFIVDALDELAARAVVPLVTPLPAPLKAVR